MLFSYTSVICQNRQDIGIKSKKPNIIFILVDDLGWSELESYGSNFNKTPHLNKLGKSGMLFTHAYAAAPVCSPTRAALLTGLYPARIGITDYLRPNGFEHLSTDYITLPEILQKHGYQTGIVGKWHLSGYEKEGGKEVGPRKHGFDEVIMTENRGIAWGSYFYPYHFNCEVKKKLPGNEYLINRLNVEAVEFIERNRNKPFFLYLSHYAVHTALQGREDLVKEFENKPNAGQGQLATKNNPHLAAMLQDIDTGVGMIVEKLETLGFLENTILIFTSDNGGESDWENAVTTNAPLRGGKSTLYEGGIRVPLIISWPSKIQGGSVCKFPVITNDFYPTLLELAGIFSYKNQQLDGVSIAPLLIGLETNLDRNTLFWHYPLEEQHFLGGTSSGAIKEGDWKLIEFYDRGKLELYNLKEDPEETKDLVTILPQEAALMQDKLNVWRKKVTDKR